MTNGKQPRHTGGLFPLFLPVRNFSKFFQFFVARWELPGFFKVGASLSLSAFVANLKLNKASVCVDRVHGFVCLLIFQVRDTRAFFFNRISI